MRVDDVLKGHGVGVGGSVSFLKAKLPIPFIKNSVTTISGYVISHDGEVYTHRINNDTSRHTNTLEEIVYRTQNNMLSHITAITNHFVVRLGSTFSGHVIYLDKDTLEPAIGVSHITNESINALAGDGQGNLYVGIGTRELRKYPPTPGDPMVWFKSLHYDFPSHISLFVYDDVNDVLFLRTRSTSTRYGIMKVSSDGETVGLVVPPGINTVQNANYAIDPPRQTIYTIGNTPTTINKYNYEGVLLASVDLSNIFQDTINNITIKNNKVEVLANKKVYILNLDLNFVSQWGIGPSFPLNSIARGPDHDEIYLRLSTGSGYLLYATEKI